MTVIQAYCPSISDFLQDLTIAESDLNWVLVSLSSSWYRRSLGQMPGLAAETVVVFRSPVIRMTVIDQIEYFVGKM